METCKQTHETHKDDHENEDEEDDVAESQLSSSELWPPVRLLPSKQPEELVADVAAINILATYRSIEEPIIEAQNYDFMPWPLAATDDKSLEVATPKWIESPADHGANAEPLSAECGGLPLACSREEHRAFAELPSMPTTDHENHETHKTHENQNNHMVDARRSYFVNLPRGKNFPL